MCLEGIILVVKAKRQMSCLWCYGAVMATVVWIKCMLKDERRVVVALKRTKTARKRWYLARICHACLAE